MASVGRVPERGVATGFSLWYIEAKIAKNDRRREEERASKRALRAESRRLVKAGREGMPNPPLQPRVGQDPSPAEPPLTAFERASRPSGVATREKPLAPIGISWDEGLVFWRGDVNMSNVEELRSWYREAKAGKVVEALRQRGYAACYVPDAAAARKKVLEIVAPGSSLATGGSMTLREAGILEALLNRGDHFITDPFLPYGPELVEQRRQALNCDVYLTSTNALTEDGILVNIDGTGNRVASMVFGPRTVVIIAGVNKIAANLDEAMRRARHYAAVLNAKRLNCETPCATKGECLDCRSPGRICRVLTIMERCPAETAVQVILVGEELGF